MGDGEKAGADGGGGGGGGGGRGAALGGGGGRTDGGPKSPSPSIPPSSGKACGGTAGLMGCACGRRGEGNGLPPIPLSNCTACTSADLRDGGAAGGCWGRICPTCGGLSPGPPVPGGTGCG